MNAHLGTSVNLYSLAVIFFLHEEASYSTHCNLQAFSHRISNLLSFHFLLCKENSMNNITVDRLMFIFLIVQISFLSKLFIALPYLSITLLINIKISLPYLCLSVCSIPLTQNILL